MKTITNKFKVALIAVGLITISNITAQTTAGNSGTVNTTQGSSAGETIRLIDNKGTIKYMQSNNGITTITSTAPDNETTTTWQLGGALVENTFINATGQIFGITGLKNTDAATNPVTDIASTGYNTTGYTIMIRDEGSGEIKKILASELLQVQGVVVEFPAPANSAANLDIRVTDMLPAVPLYKVSVYRNGAKLRAGTDYVAGTDVVTVQPQAPIAGLPNDPNAWQIATRDVFEIHWIK